MEWEGEEEIDGSIVLNYYYDDQLTIIEAQKSAFDFILKKFYSLNERTSVGGLFWWSESFIELI